MADIKLSGIGITAINGSIGNTTFSRNYYGTYAKKRKAAPASTPGLVSWQLIIRTFGTYWINSMNDLQRSEWYQWKLPLKDELGATHTLTGFDLYMNYNLNLYLIGLGGPRNAPPDYNLSRGFSCWALQSLTGSSPYVGSLVILPIWLGAVNNFAIYATPAMSLGRMSFSQVYTYIGSIASTAGSFIDLTSMYALRLLPPISGTKVFIKLCPTDPTTALRMPASCCSVIVS